MNLFNSRALGITFMILGGSYATDASARIQCFYRGEFRQTPQAILNIQHPDNIPLRQVLHQYEYIVGESIEVACLHDEGAGDRPFALAVNQLNYTGQAGVGQGFYSFNSAVIAQRVTIQEPGKSSRIVNLSTKQILSIPGFAAQPGLGPGVQPTTWTTILQAGTRFLYEVAKGVNKPAPGNSQYTTSLVMAAEVNGDRNTESSRFGIGNALLNFKVKPTCSVTAKDLNVRIPAMAPKALDQAGETRPGTANISLSCQGGDGTDGSEANVFMHLSDAIQPSNSSDILAATPGSSAKGVSVQARRADGTPVALDRDGSRKWWALDAGPGVHQIPLTFVGVKTTTEDVTGGTYGGRVNFTLTYY